MGYSMSGLSGIVAFRERAFEDQRLWLAMAMLALERWEVADFGRRWNHRGFGSIHSWGGVKPKINHHMHERANGSIQETVRDVYAMHSLRLTRKNNEAQRKVFRRNQRLKTFADPKSSNQLSETGA
jgi:hypothetical protein